MEFIKNILLPTDFSKKSERAVPFAVDILKKTNGKLSLLNAIRIPNLKKVDFEDRDFFTVASIVAKTRDKSLTKLKNIINDNNINQYKHRCYVREGLIDKEILRSIKKGKMDLVIMGTNGGEAEHGFFNGSITKKIIQRSTCPVLAITKSANFHEISTIVYATNLKYDETNVLKYISQFASMYGAEIILLHIDHNKKMIKKNSQILKEIINSSNYKKITFQEIIAENTEEGIHEYISKNNIDLLVLTTHSNGLIDKLFHKSLTKALLMDTHTPLLIFNEKF